MVFVERFYLVIKNEYKLELRRVYTYLNAKFGISICHNSCVICVHTDKWIEILFAAKINMLQSIIQFMLFATPASACYI